MKSLILPGALALRVEDAVWPDAACIHLVRETSIENQVMSDAGHDNRDVAGVISLPR